MKPKPSTQDRNELESAWERGTQDAAEASPRSDDLNTILTNGAGLSLSSGIRSGKWHTVHNKSTGLACT